MEKDVFAIGKEWVNPFHPEFKAVFFFIFSKFSQFIKNIFEDLSMIAMANSHPVLYISNSQSNTLKYEKKTINLIKLLIWGAKNGPAGWNGLIKT